MNLPNRRLRSAYPPITHSGAFLWADPFFGGLSLFSRFASQDESIRGTATSPLDGRMSQGRNMFVKRLRGELP
jgi:hypothetical protein